MISDRLTRPVPIALTVLLVLATLVTAGAVATALALAGPRASQSAGAEREDVLVIGDSLTLASKDALTSDLDSLGYEAQIDGKNGRRIADAVPLLKQARANGELTRTVVIALGTNDYSTPVPELAIDIDRVLNTIGSGRSTVWVNTFVDVDVADRFRRYERVNGMLEKQAIARPSLTIVDWQGYAEREVPSGRLTLDPDGIHYPKASVLQRSALIAGALPTCQGCDDIYRNPPTPNVVVP